jgi:hypothetical protein
MTMTMSFFLFFVLLAVGALSIGAVYEIAGELESNRAAVRAGILIVGALQLTGMTIAYLAF